MSDGIKVDYAEIDRLTTGITALNTFAGPLVPKVGALSADGDLLASAILSPGTALAAEGAVLKASAQLSVTIVSTEALVIITASFSKVYEAAEAGLALSILAVEVSVAAAKNKASEIEGVVRGLPDLVADLSGVAAWALRGALAESAVALAIAESKGKNPLDWFRAWTDGAADGLADGLQLGIEGLGPDYGGLLGRLIHDGQVFGMFEDGDGVFGAKHGADAQELRKRADDAWDASLAATGVPTKRDKHGLILPNNASSLLQGASQIDAIGKKDLADIRVLTVHMADGSYRFTVQIPSTLNWSMYAGANPNDLTSDMTALDSGTTALSRASFEALQRAMDAAHKESGQPVQNSPVMLTGFSLGGITAAAMAAEPGKYNIQQVVTAGSPIANFDIPEKTDVMALEAHGDPIPSLDGGANPRGENWTTAFDAPSHLLGEKDGSTVSPIGRHNANRYSAMARQYADDDSGINWFLNGGIMTAKDYHVTRG